MSINSNSEITDTPEVAKSNTEKEMLHGYSFYKSIGSPKLIVAPMVDHSKLAFRMLARKYGAQLCYTPMINAKMYVKSETTRKLSFQTAPEDRPLFVQWCGNDAEKLRRAAEYMLEEGDVCDAFDLNCG